MQHVREPKDTAGYHFQVDLLNLNLQLAMAEAPAEASTQQQEKALAQMRSMAALG